MMWFLLGWLVIAVVLSTVCGRVLGASERHRAPVDSDVAPVPSVPSAPLSTI